MTGAQLKTGLPSAEVAVLDSNGGVLLTRTPLWYYVLREAAVQRGGKQLGPVGARIVAETFAQILKRDPSSHLNAAGGFSPFLPFVTAGSFTVADLIAFARVTQPKEFLKPRSALVITPMTANMPASMRERAESHGSVSSRNR